MNLKFKVLDGGTLPTRAHREDAGFDLYAPEDFEIYCNSVKLIKTKICVEVPQGYVGFIMGRSSLNMAGIACLTGVIDSGYTGELGITLFNCAFDWLGNRKFKKGDRIAQLVVAKLADIDNAVAVDSLEDSERSNNGFGSTGV